MSFGAPPLLASDELIAQFESTDKLWARLWVEVVSNPLFKDGPDCNRKEVAAAYTNEWLPYAKVWRSSLLWDSYDRADESALNGLTGRANGYAKACLPGFAPHMQVKGRDVEDENPTAAYVDINAPGGGPPRPGAGILGFKKSTLVLGGLALMGGGIALRYIFH